MSNDNESSRDAVQSAPWWDTDDLEVNIEDSIRNGDFIMSMASEERFVLVFIEKENVRCASCQQPMAKGHPCIHDNLQGLDCHRVCPEMKGVAAQDNFEILIHGPRRRTWKQQLRDYPPVECPQSERESWGL